jgi:hypothetical protein
VEEAPQTKTHHPILLQGEIPRWAGRLEAAALEVPEVQEDLGNLGNPEGANQHRDDSHKEK